MHTTPSGPGTARPPPCLVPTRVRLRRRLRWSARAHVSPAPPSEDPGSGVSPPPFPAAVGASWPRARPLLPHHPLCGFALSSSGSRPATSSVTAAPSDIWRAISALCLLLCHLLCDFLRSPHCPVKGLGLYPSLPFLVAAALRPSCPCAARSVLSHSGPPRARWASPARLCQAGRGPRSHASARGQLYVAAPSRSGALTQRCQFAVAAGTSPRRSRWAAFAGIGVFPVRMVGAPGPQLPPPPRAWCLWQTEVPCSLFGEPRSRSGRL